MKSIFSIMLLVVMALTIGCKKDKDKIGDPELYIDASGNIWSTTNAVAWKSQHNGHLTIQATNIDNVTDQFVMTISGTSIGTYSLTDQDNGCSYNGYITKLEDNHEGEIIITVYNSEDGIVSGTFHFVVRNSEDEIRDITGRFNNLPIHNSPI